MDATATAKLALDASGLDRGLQSATTSLDKFAKQTGSVLAGAFAFDKLISGFSSAIEKGDQLQDIAEKFGVSASKLQMLGNAASVFGSGLDQVSAGLNKLSLAQQKAVSGEAGAEALVATFAEVGINLEELRTMGAEDIFLRIADSFASGANDGRQFVIVNELLGKAQTDLIKVLNQGSAAIIEQGNAIGVFSDDTISSLSELSDQIKVLQNNMTMGFGNVAALLNPFIKGLQDALELAVMLGVAVKEAATGNFAGAKEIGKRASGLGTEKMAERDKAEKAKKSPSKSNSERELVNSQKDLDKVEKDAIKERTDLALHILKNEEAESKLANDSYERKRDIERERMLEAANIEVKAAQEKMKLQQEQAAREKGMAAGPGGTSRQFEQARGGAASDVLNFAGGLGDRSISAMVQQERTKAAKEQQKVNRKEFDAKVMDQTSATTKNGDPRDMQSRRREFIQKEAQKESKGTKSLADIYQVLNDALTKITSTPIVSV
jgi:hypothetical protein